MKKNKLFSTEIQFLNAQKKAFRLWDKLHKEMYTLYKKDGSRPFFNSWYYIAINPSGEAYVVCHEVNKINTATGMFRFYSNEMAEKFIKEMGSSIYKLFPKHRLV